MLGVRGWRHRHAARLGARRRARGRRTRSDSPRAQGCADRGWHADDVRQLSRALRRSRPRQSRPPTRSASFSKSCRPSIRRPRARQRDNGALVELLRTYPGSIGQRARRALRRLGQARAASDPPTSRGTTPSAAARRSIASSRSTARSCCSAAITTPSPSCTTPSTSSTFPTSGWRGIKVPVDEDGERVWRDMEEFDTADAGAHANWPPRFFAQARRQLPGEDRQHAAAWSATRGSFLFDSRGLLDSR